MSGARWMWADPKGTVFGQQSAQVNPLRWSRKRSLRDTVNELDELMYSRHRQRSVLLSIGKEQIVFDNVADAKLYLAGVTGVQVDDWIVAKEINGHRQKWFYIPDLVPRSAGQHKLLVLALEQRGYRLKHSGLPQTPSDVSTDISQPDLAVPDSDPNVADGATGTASPRPFVPAIFAPSTKPLLSHSAVEAGNGATDTSSQPPSAACMGAVIASSRSGPGVANSAASATSQKTSVAPSPPLPCQAAIAIVPTAAASPPPRGADAASGAAGNTSMELVAACQVPQVTSVKALPYLPAAGIGKLKIDQVPYLEA